MSKVDFRRLSRKQKEILTRELRGTLQSFKKNKELIKFLEGLITPSEYVMFARRIRIAKMLLSGTPHLEIRRKLGVGFTTVRSVDEWLRSSFHDYSKVIPPYIYEAREKYEGGTLVAEILEPITSAFRKLHPFHYALIKFMIEGWEEIEQVPIPDQRSNRKKRGV